MKEGTDSLYEHVVHRGQGVRPVIERGEGVYLFDRQGKCYLDGASGAAVANLGHGVQGIAQAMHEQAKRVSFAAPHVFAHQSSRKEDECIKEFYTIRVFSCWKPDYFTWQRRKLEKLFSNR